MKLYLCRSSQRNNLNFCCNRPARGAVKGLSGSSSVMDEAMVLELFQRLSRLEQREQSQQIEQRLDDLSSAVQGVHTSLQSSQLLLSELQKQVLELQSKYTIQAGLLELLQRDNDSKRSALAKMDSWSRQGESWRDDTDQRIEALTKQLKSLQRGKE